MTATRYLLEYLFGDISGSLRWEKTGTATNQTTGRRRRLYGTKQRSSARAGEKMTLKLANGDEWSCRVVGTHLDFIDNLLGRAQQGRVVGIMSERGTDYGPQLRSNVV
jgi:hypothetical protein